MNDGSLPDDAPPDRAALGFVPRFQVRRRTAAAVRGAPGRVAGVSHEDCPVRIDGGSGTTRVTVAARDPV